MALARAERRALKRAFNVPVANLVTGDTVDDYELGDDTNVIDAPLAIHDVEDSSSSLTVDTSAEDDGGDAPTAGNHLPSRETSPPSTYTADDPERPFDVATGEIAAPTSPSAPLDDDPAHDPPADTDGIALAERRANEARARRDAELFPDSDLEQRSAGELRALAETRGLIEAGTTSRTHPKTKLLEVLRGAP
jgi:hypothetical protein